MKRNVASNPQALTLVVYVTCAKRFVTSCRSINSIYIAILIALYNFLGSDKEHTALDLFIKADQS